MFDRRKKDFENEIINKFFANKKVHEVKSKFFNHQNSIYSIINLIYSRIL